MGIIQRLVGNLNVKDIYIIDTKDRECKKVWKIKTTRGIYMLDFDDVGYFIFLPNNYLEEGFSMIYDNSDDITLVDFLEHFTENNHLEDILGMEIF